ncbi:MAG: hypothetical protein AB1758_17625, partial [Candidatus Eremiobacterota bacterium]
MSLINNLNKFFSRQVTLEKARFEAGGPDSPGDLPAWQRMQAAGLDQVAVAAQTLAERDNQPGDLNPAQG